MVTDAKGGRVIWRGTAATVRTRRTLQGIKRYYEKTIELGIFGVSRGGLLDEAISSLALPIDFTEGNQLTSMLEALKEDPEAVRILSTPLNQLARHHLVVLFGRMEFAIAKSPTIQGNSRNSVSGFWRRPFTRPSLLLGDGSVSDSTGFRSSFPSHHSAEGRLRAGQQKARGIYSGTTENIDPADPEKSWKAAIGATLSGLESACWKVIDDYLEVSERHRSLRKAAAKIDDEPEDKGSRTLIEIIRKIENERLYLAESWNDGEKPTCLSITGLDWYRLKKVKTQPDRLFSRKFRWQEFLFCQYYLPRLVVQAAQMLILCRTGWNVSTVAAMEREQVHIVDGYCDLFPTKSKTSDSLHIRIYCAKEPRLVALIRMLIENDKAVSRDWQRLDQTLWVSWTTRQLAFASDTHGRSLEIIARVYGGKRLTKKGIRDYKHAHSWLEHGDIFQSKEDLDHQSIDTAIAYLNLHVFSALNEANMAKFMGRLERTVVWIGRNGMAPSDSMQLLKGHAEENLLFPLPGREGQRNHAACDRWINGIGDDSIRIGPTEIAHLKWQTRYYEKYALDLSRDNPLQFQTIHLPRMLFAAALSRVVADSPFERYMK